MDEDRPEDTTLSPDSGRAKRAPPTIDLEASEVSGETKGAGTATGTDAPPRPSRPWLSADAIAATATSAVTGAVTAALVIAAAWYLGWPSDAAAPSAAPPASTAAIDTLTSRVADIESRSARLPVTASDPAAAARIEALEKTIAALRSEIAGARAQSEKLASDVNAVKSAPREAAPPDLSAIDERLGQIERTTRAEIAQQSNKPADDAALRRVVVASMLDVSVRQGEPFAAALAAAKSLAPDANTLKPLDDFAKSGVPSAAILSRELLTLVPKLTPPVPETSTTTTTTGAGIIDRLQAGAAKLVRIERTDAVGNDRSAIVARVTAAALRNDSAEARRELNALAPADRAAAQPWLDKADERDAALAASRQFAADAMAALAKPAP
jgi:hypothetical protein